MNRRSGILWEPELPHPSQEDEGHTFEKRDNELIEQLQRVFEQFRATFSGVYSNNNDIDFSRYDRRNLAELYTWLMRLLSFKERNMSNKEIVDYTKRISQEYPHIYKTFLDVLKQLRNSEEKKWDDTISSITNNRPINPEYERRLESKTIHLEKPLTLEQKQLLQQNFRSGNFLLHTANNEVLLEILKNGKILTSSEVEILKRKSWGRGGGDGISFNTNNVRVLTGTPLHFAGLLMAPESVLDTQGAYQLIVPESAAVYETRLVNKNYNIEKHHQEQEEKMFSGYINYSKDIKSLPKVPIEKTFLFCSEKDLPKFKAVIAALGIEPLGIITYPNKELRVESWLEPVGDHVNAGKLLQDMIKNAGLKPSINWQKDLFVHPPRFKEETYVDSRDIISARAISNSPTGLQVVNRSRPRYY